MLLHAQRDHRSLINNMDDRVSHFGGSVPGDARRDRDDRLVTTKPTLRAATVPVLNRRTGHARFRRGPVVVAQQQNPQPSVGAADTPPLSASSASSSLRLTAGSGEGSVSGGAFRARSSPFAANTTGRAPVRSVGPDCAPGRVEANRKCHGRARSENDVAGGGRCHCSKKRGMSRAKKVIIRVPAMISSRNNAADIIPPDDDSSWRKYGQKPIKGSPYPRGYYKCSTVRGCPARKHVERDPGEPAMLIVTYEGDHRHDQLGNAAVAPAY